MALRPDPDTEPLLRIIARRTVRWARREAETRTFGGLLIVQSLGAAGDALVALALAGSLFFSVPEADARGRVALYLVTTMAPFSLVAPLLSAWIDRHPAGLRGAMIVAGLGRGACAWLLATRLDTIYSFPLAFAVLVLSRVALVAKGAILPSAVPEGRTLVAANASLSKFTALAATIAAAPGLAVLKWIGPATELIFAAIVYALGVLAAFRLPTERRRKRTTGAEIVRRHPMPVRQAAVATTAMRLLVGFTVVHLGFALRREDLSSIGLGVLIASAVFGAFLGALVAARARKRLREEGIIAASLALAGAAGLIAGRWFSIATASGLVLVFGLASGASKVAFDSVVQRDTAAGSRGWAFARFESLLQLGWVLGALIPVLIALPIEGGVVGAGIGALAFALLYLIGRGRSARLANGTSRSSAV